jgi:hypothetical protein
MKDDIDLKHENPDITAIRNALNYLLDLLANETARRLLEDPIDSRDCYTGAFPPGSPEKPMDRK